MNKNGFENYGTVINQIKSVLRQMRGQPVEAVKSQPKREIGLSK
jgi:hypothetical protein